METGDASIGWSLQGLRPGVFVEVVQCHEVTVHGWLCNGVRTAHTG